jgi:uncharacterized membrane protein YoaK (UPF0700 family)
MKNQLSVLLSLNAGFVDTAGYLALQGLFTAHVTGNFVTFGAALVLGTSGALAKLMALPVFCVVVAGTRGLGNMSPSDGRLAMQTSLVIKLLLLVLGAVLAIQLGPFTHGDAWPALATGMTLVAAMSIQNATQRIHLASSPPTTLMTGTTTQIMIDITDTVQGLQPEARAVTRLRLGRLVTSVAAFATGCGAAALLYAKVGVWCFAVPPLLALIAVLVALPRETPVRV